MYILYRITFTQYIQFYNYYMYIHVSINNSNNTIYYIINNNDQDSSKQNDLFIHFESNGTSINHLSGSLDIKANNVLSLHS